MHCRFPYSSRIAQIYARAGTVPFSQSCLRSVELAQRAHNLWVVDQEGRVLEVDLQEMAHQLVDEACSRSGISAVHFVELSLLIKKLVRLFRL